MSLQRGVDGPEPLRFEPVARLDGTYELRRSQAPLAPRHRHARLPALRRAGRARRPPAAPADALACPFCGHAGALRDFLSLAAPARPARVDSRDRAAP